MLRLSAAYGAQDGMEISPRTIRAMTRSTDTPSWWRRLTVALGLVYSEQGQPMSGSPKRASRYRRGAVSPSPRLDEDIDDIRARLAALEDRLRDQPTAGTESTD